MSKSHDEYFVTTPRLLLRAPPRFDAPLELGGSNVIANLFPEKGNAHPGYRAKAQLEYALHGIVCGGAMRLRTAQRRLAAHWSRLYAQVFGLPPPR